MRAPGRTVVVDLPGARALRVEYEPDGMLVLAVGWLDPWRAEPGQRLTLPAYQLPELAAALQELAEEVR